MYNVHTAYRILHAARIKYIDNSQSHKTKNFSFFSLETLKITLLLHFAKSFDKKYSNSSYLLE